MFITGSCVGVTRSPCGMEAGTLELLLEGTEGGQCRESSTEFRTGGAPMARGGSTHTGQTGIHRVNTRLLTGCPQSSNVPEHLQAPLDLHDICLILLIDAHLIFHGLVGVDDRAVVPSPEV